MSLEILPNLADLLREFNLAEPEVNVDIPLGEKTYHLIVAFPEQRCGIIEANEIAGETMIGGWSIWNCADEHSVRAALRQIAVRAGTFEDVSDETDLTILRAHVEQGRWEAAEQELSKIRGQLSVDSPILEEIKELRRVIYRGKRDSSGSGSISNGTSYPSLNKPISQAIREDRNRLFAENLPAHNLFGFFTERKIELEGQVDAVWLASVGGEESNVWTATSTGYVNQMSEVEKLDQEVAICDTETELLNALVEQIADSKVIWVWDRYLVTHVLKRWHFRATGRSVSEQVLSSLLDLRSLCLVAFPTAQRTDRPESLCDELNIKFRDELANGGRLAAQEALLQACVKVISTSQPALQEACWNLFQSYLPKEWLNALFINRTNNGFEGYLDLLEQTFKSFPEPVQSSSGHPNTESIQVEDFFRKSGGFLAQVTGEGYEERKGQVEFAQKVMEGLKDITPHVLEAGTGIGKTKGYLVPLLLNGKRTYVATHTKNLQDQAWSKDVPEVLKAFGLAGIGRSVSILKGKNNYVCLQTVADWLEEIREVVQSVEDSFSLAAILNWLLQTKTGWLSELGSLSNQAMIHRLGRDQAQPSPSDRWEDLEPHHKAFEASQTVDLVLVNHSYVFAIALNENATEPPVDAIVFDEAHNIEDGATEALTLDFEAWGLKREIDKLFDRTKEEKKIAGPVRPLFEFEDLKHRPIIQNFTASLLELEQAINQWCMTCGERFADLGEESYNEDPDYPVVFPNDQFWIPNLLDQVTILLPKLENVKTYGSGLLEELLNIKSAPKRIYASISSLVDHVEEASEALMKLLDFNDEAYVRWGEARVQVDENGAPKLISNAPVWEGILHTTPLSVAEWLQKTLYPRYGHKIFVSATLAMGERFENILTSLGLIQDNNAIQPITHVFPSPFNYRDNVLLSVFSDAAFPVHTTDTLYLDSLAKNISELTKLGDGCTLVLFTSRKTLQQVGLRLRAELETSGIVPLIQTEGNRAALVERFRRGPKAGEKLVLLGLRAFWEGVDIPGDPLKILVITRLPFDYYGHPVALARQNHFRKTNLDGDYFREVVIPGTFLHLRQMYGRLIRKQDDRGICVFLDPRIADRRYGRHLLSLLPLSQQITAPAGRNLEQIKKFLHGQTIDSEFTVSEPIYSSAELSSEQLNIVNAKDQRILVRAAAGSGKTRVLIERIIRIIKEGKARDITKILALTYTVKAEKVMQERLFEALGPQSFSLERNILTYHKFASRILRSDFQGNSTDLNWVNEDSPEEQELFAYARSRSSLSERELTKEDARTVIAYAQNGLVDETQLSVKMNDLSPYTQKLAKFYLAYVEKLREKGWLDYGEAIVRSVSLLRNDSEKRQKWASRFDWIFCDEYQDTSPAQSRLLDIVGQNANLFVVGDSAQSIYSWMGSNPDNLFQFELDFPGTIVYHLSKNYRSFPKLVKVSNRFLERCGQKHGIRVVWDEKRSNENQNVFYLASPSDWEEAKQVALLAKAALDLPIPGEPPPIPTVGILARKWELLSSLEYELIRNEIPYDFEGDTARGIRKEPKIEKIIERSINLIMQAQNMEEPGDTPDGRIVNNIQTQLIARAAELIEAVRALLGFMDLSTNPTEPFGRLRSALGDLPVQALKTIFDKEEKKGRVILSTVHSQKGEEFDTVFVLGLEKGNSPHQPPRSHQQILEWRKVVQNLSLATWQKNLSEDDLQRIYSQEEERIFYVAMTRSRLNLIIGHSEKRNQRPYAKSEFLEKANLLGAVMETTSADQIYLAVPVKETPDAGYRAEGRMYWTNSGVRVRSKSEAMLANELTRRGILYEYEVAPDNVSGALPDFILPDYGDVIIEHLGLLDQDAYRERWENKKREYEGAGGLYIPTNEQEIIDVSGAVDRIVEVCRSYVFGKGGEERWKQIELLEKLRREGHLLIGRPVRSFAENVYFVTVPENPKQRFVYIPTGNENPPVLDELPTDLGWEETKICEVKVLLA